MADRTAAEAPAQAPEYLTIGEVAARLGVHYRTVYEMAKKKQIPSVRVGNLWRLRWDQVEKALAGD